MNQDSLGNKLQVEELKKEFAQITAARQAEEQKFKQSSHLLTQDLNKRVNNNKVIQDAGAKQMFIKLCHINTNLTKDYFDVLGKETAAKLWMNDIISDVNAGHVIFMDKDGSECKTPEMVQMTNLFEQMRTEWVEEYFPILCETMAHHRKLTDLQKNQTESKD